MNDHVVKTHWFKLTVKSTAIVNELVTYLATVVPKYYWGTLCVELSSDQVSQIHTMFPEKIKVTEIHACCTDVVIESIWDHPTEVYAAALKQTQLDYEQIDEAFKSDFEYLFKTNKDGSLIFRKDTHLEVSLFAVKYAHKIQSLSGLPCIVPRLSAEPSASNEHNTMELLKLFISAYPAYYNLCKNMGREKNFKWKYTINVEN